MLANGRPAAANPDDTMTLAPHRGRQTTPPETAKSPEIRGFEPDCKEVVYRTKPMAIIAALLPV